MFPAQDTNPVRSHISDTLAKLRYEGPHKKSIDIADYYGFHFVGNLTTKRDDASSCESCGAPTDKAAVLRHYVEHALDGYQQPVLLSHITKASHENLSQLKLEVLGSQKSIAEALLLHTASVILKENGASDIVVHINSIGGRDSIERFSKDLASFYRKHMESLHEACRSKVRTDVFAPFHCTDEACVKLRSRAPRSISYLTEPSRRHFTNIIEYLETINMPYTIKEHLVGNHHYTTRTLFEMRALENDTEQETPPLAYGERYDNLSKALNLGRTIHGVGLTISMNPSKAKERVLKYKKAPVRKPQAFLVQVGLSARRVALPVCEMLRSEGIPITTTFNDDTLHDQMQIAQQVRPPVIVIIGQKEVLDNTAIIRNLDTREQYVVPQRNLARFLRRT